MREFKWWKNLLDYDEDDNLKGETSLYTVILLDDRDEDLKVKTPSWIMMKMTIYKVKPHLTMMTMIYVGKLD